ncbi:MAG: hypothetical protein MUD12_02300 [Spirochaetes bacterium]|nr:hypothetical protein [Spirochaetota bacterium]
MAISTGRTDAAAAAIDFPGVYAESFSRVKVSAQYFLSIIICRFTVSLLYFNNLFCDVNSGFLNSLKDIGVLPQLIGMDDVDSIKEL